MTSTKVLTIVSGGQTGVDRAALDAALEAGLPCGGWCPKGRRAEDGPIDPKYPLSETPSEEYHQRTEWNVRDSDATLVLSFGPPSGGTKLTLDYALRWKKPFTVMELTEDASTERILRWIETEKIGRLNIAGPRKTPEADAYAPAKKFLARLFQDFNNFSSLPERRYALRVNKPVRVALRIGSSPEETGTLRDLNERGAYLLSSKLLSIGVQVSLKLEMPGALSDVALVISARVIRIETRPGVPVHGYGLKFSPLSAEDQKLLRIVFDSDILAP